LVREFGEDDAPHEILVRRIDNIYTAQYLKLQVF